MIKVNTLGGKAVNSGYSIENKINILHVEVRTMRTGYLFPALLQKEVELIGLNDQ